jgi:hypothetical protein
MRVVRVFGVDLLALILGFAMSSLGLTVVSAAHRTDNGASMAPTVSLLTPTNGQAVSGNVVLSATAGPNTESLQFQVGGSDVGPQITSGACSMTWSTTVFTDGSYAVTVVAMDGNGNSAAATPVTVTVENTPPAIVSIQTSSITASSAVVSWSTSLPASSGVDFGPTSYVNSLLDGHLVTSHSATLGNLAPSTPYHFRVNSANGAGVLATSGDQTFTTAAGGGSAASPTPPPPTSPAPTPTPPPTSPTPPPPMASASGTVQGILSNPTLGVMPKTLVALVNNGQTVAMTTSDANGYFQFTNVPPGTYQVYGMLSAASKWLFETVQVTG